MQRFKLFVTSAERTALAQELMDHMTKVEQVYKQTKLLIDRARCNAQPNKAHRNEDNLLPDEDEWNERLRYAAVLRETATGAFSDNAHLSTYLKNMADAHETIEKQHIKFLKQVQTFCIKEWKKFTEEIYVKIKQAYTDMEYRRDAYDLARHKLKSCYPEEIEQRGQTAATAQKDFEAQAIVLHELLLKMPENQMAIAKAAYLYLRSETDLAKQTMELFRKISSPESKADNQATVMATTTVQAAASKAATTTNKAPPTTTKAPPKGSTVKEKL